VLAAATGVPETYGPTTQVDSQDGTTGFDMATCVMGTKAVEIAVGDTVIGAAVVGA
jgi:hypothetical protein